MSLSSSHSSSSPETQASSLIAFLAEGQHNLAQDDARLICAQLPADNKLAARQLKQFLADKDISIKHTHALRAVARLRGSPGYLGLGDATRWEVASWVLDAPAVSARRELFPDLGKACDQLCARLREQFDPGDAPLLHFQASANAVVIEGVGDPHPTWRVVLVAVDTKGIAREFDLEPQLRLAERVRRLVEGEFGGWLDGIVALDAVRNLAAQAMLQIEGQPDMVASDAALLAEIEDRSERWPDITAPEDVSDAEGRRLTLSVRIGEKVPASLSASGWDALHARYLAFSRRNQEAFSEWWRQRQQEAAQARFAPEALNTAALEVARLRRGLSHEDVALALGIEPRVWREHVEAEELPVAWFTPLRRVLGLASENELLGVDQRARSIPLPRHEDIGMFLSRFEVLEADGDQGEEGLLRRLEHVCQVPFGQRRRWDKHPSAELKALNQEARHAGQVLCGTLEKQFVQDLPLGGSRLGLVLVLRFEKAVDVHTQRGQLDIGNTAMKLPPEDEPVSADWLARFNAVKFTGEELLKYSEKVNEMRDPEGDGEDAFHTTMFAAVKVFGKEPNKAHTATVRMEALSRLMLREPMDPWVLRSAEEGSSMLSRPVFEAAARCVLIDVQGEPGFDANALRLLLVEHARSWEH